MQSGKHILNGRPTGFPPAPRLTQVPAPIIMKKRYVISYIGLFEFGYVQLNWFKKNQSVPFKTTSECEKFASKFKFKWVANLWCRILNFNSERECTLRTFKLEQLWFT